MMKDVAEPLPCPWCKKIPSVLPHNWLIGGSHWAGVARHNSMCVSRPSVKVHGTFTPDNPHGDKDGEQLSNFLKSAAIRKWNSYEHPSIKEYDQSEETI